MLLEPRMDINDVDVLFDIHEQMKLFVLSGRGSDEVSV